MPGEGDVLLPAKDVCRTIVAQSRTAANDVCAQQFLDLVGKLGREFVKAAGRRLIHDSEALARAKLRALPEGPGGPGGELAGHRVPWGEAYAGEYREYCHPAAAHCST